MSRVSWGLLIAVLAWSAEPCSAQEVVIEDGVTMKSQRYNLTLRIPKDWGRFRTGAAMKWRKAGVFCEGASKDGNCAFMVSAEPGKGTLEALVKAWEKAAKGRLKLRLESQERGVGAWRRSYHWPHKKAGGADDLKFVVVFRQQGGLLFRLTIWYAASRQDEFSSAVDVMTGSFRRLSDKGQVTGGIKMKVPSPWGACQRGSWVHYVIREGGKTRDEKWRLTDPGDGTYYKIRRERRVGIKWVSGREETVLLTKLAGDGSRPLETGREALVTEAGRFDCVWAKRAKDGGVVTRWESKSVPLGLVKSVTSIKEMVTRVELVGFKRR